MAKKATQARKKTRKSMKKTAAKPAARKSAGTKSPAKKAVAKGPVVRGSTLVSVSPSFTASDLEASLKWYCDVLGFTVKERWDDHGQFIGAQIGSGRVLVNLMQDDWKRGRDRVKGQGTRMFITTGPDIDGYASAIKARGGVLASEPVTEWGMRAFSINDPDGFKLTFMTELPK